MGHIFRTAKVSLSRVWRHRFLSLVEKDKPKRLTGIVEADETFFQESFKGQKRDMPRPARKRGTKVKKRGASEEYKPVLIMRDRGEVTREELLKGTNTEEISGALRTVIDREAVLCTDGGAALPVAPGTGMPLLLVFHPHIQTLAPTVLVAPFL